jgi:hypothetical protein
VDVVVAVVAGVDAGGEEAVDGVLEDDELPHPASASRPVAAASAQPPRCRRVLGLDV